MSLGTGSFGTQLYINNRIIVRSIAPGTPRMLTNIMVKKFKPMWKLNKFPIKFITRIMTAPINEFSKSLSMTFRGTIKILQSTNIMHKPARYVKTLISSNF